MCVCVCVCVCMHVCACVCVSTSVCAYASVFLHECARVHRLKLCIAVIMKLLVIHFTLANKADHYPKDAT